MLVFSFRKDIQETVGSEKTDISIHFVVDSEDSAKVSLQVNGASELRGMTSTVNLCSVETMVFHIVVKDVVIFIPTCISDGSICEAAAVHDWKITLHA